MSARRLRVRLSIGTLLVLAILAIAAHDGGDPSFRIGSFIAASLGSVALIEYARMAGLSGSAVGRAALVGGVAAMFWRSVADVAAPRTALAGLFCVAFGLACAAPIVASVLSRRRGPVDPTAARELGAALLGVLVVVFPVLCLVEIGYLMPGEGFSPRACRLFSSVPQPITEEKVGPWLLLITILVSKLNDIGGYLVGVAVGKHPLAPGISPKKSVEGAVAGLALGIAGAVLAFSWFCPAAGLLPAPLAVTFGILVSVATQFGDLCESLIKRSCGVKDSGALIPAFGGILDLLDSFILAAPTGYTLLWLWLP